MYSYILRVFSLGNSMMIIQCDFGENAPSVYACILRVYMLANDNYVQYTGEWKGVLSLLN